MNDSIRVRARTPIFPEDVYVEDMRRWQREGVQAHLLRVQTHLSRLAERYRMTKAEADTGEDKERRP